MNENELLEYQKMLDMINTYNKKSVECCNAELNREEEERDYSIRKPASSEEGPLPLPTPALPPLDEPAAPGEGPVPLPTPSLPPVRPASPVIQIKPVIPPWSGIKPAPNCMGACLPFAYPSVEVKNRDENASCLIYELLSGTNSVLSAFLLCTYDGAYFYDERNNAAKIFKDIALCKQNHLNMLSLLLSKMGVMPKYHGCQRGKYTWWQGGEINYPTYLKMALLDLIDMETKLINDFEFAAADSRDPYVSTLLRRIAMDDKYHLESFTELYNKCCR